MPIAQSSGRRDKLAEGARSTTKMKGSNSASNSKSVTKLAVAA